MADSKSLWVVLGVKMEGLTTGLRQAKRDLREFGLEMTAIGAAITGVMALAIKDSGAMEKEFSKLKDAVKGLESAIADALEPVLKPILEQITRIIEAVNNWARANPELFNTIVVIGAALGVVIGAIGSLLIILPHVVSAIRGMQVAFALLNTVMAANPILLIVSALALLGSAIAGFVMSNNSATQSQDSLNNSFDIAAYRAQKQNELMEDLAKKTDRATLAIEAQKKALDDAYSKAVDELAELIKKQEDLEARYNDNNIHILSGGPFDPNSKYYTPMEWPEYVPDRIPWNVNGANSPVSGSYTYPQPLNVTINVEGDVTSENDLAEKIYNKMLQIKDRNFDSGF